MKLVHIRVPGRNTAERLTSIRESYVAGTLNLDRLLFARIEINETEPFWIGARYAHPDKRADNRISELAESADEIVRGAIRAKATEALVVTDAQYVIVATDLRGAAISSDNREAHARANDSLFSRELWSLLTSRRLKNWSWPRVVVYDYDGHDGRKVWSWVFHIGPFWIIRERYAI